MKPWSKFSWKNYIVQQQPKWPNSEDYNQVIKEHNATRSQMEKNRRIKIVFTNK